MRISVKGRYALASMIYMASNFESGEYISIVNIASHLGISKIYLEQIFSLLKKSELVKSVKGPQGGYILAKSPKDISAYEILNASEISLFESTESTVGKNTPAIEAAMQELIFDNIDSVLKAELLKVSLKDLLLRAERNKKKDTLMFYI